MGVDGSMSIGDRSKATSMVPRGGITTPAGSRAPISSNTRPDTSTASEVPLLIVARSTRPDTSCSVISTDNTGSDDCDAGRYLSDSRYMRRLGITYCSIRIRCACSNDWLVPYWPHLRRSSSASADIDANNSATRCSRYPGARN